MKFDFDMIRKMAGLTEDADVQDAQGTDRVDEEIGGASRGITNAVSFLGYAKDEFAKDKGRNGMAGIADAISALAILLKWADKEYVGVKKASDLLRKAAREIAVAIGKV
jgi:hypothetical protein